ncbi:MAG TPA: GNAT family N-acetyltransferase [Streptosporangiaceae bacterium]|nr:GNAT family N-acetyltransferase [Streptosporangiaceae bacterium]
MPPRPEDVPPADAPPERVEAGSVIVRRVQASDASAIAAAVGASLDTLRPWMPWATPAAADRANQLARVAEADHRWESGLSYTYSVLTAETGTLVGEVALHRRMGDSSAEIGYWIAAGQAGRGYGTSASAALTSVALALNGVTRVEIHCDAANAGSVAVARRLGYRLDRIEERRPEAPGESGRLMIWVRDRKPG